jgi:redox-sensitive bicupin YhaK (pirin superfamily)
MKKVIGIHGNPNQHWVGDGFPVRTLFSYDRLGPLVSPFLLLDFGGPAVFEPADKPRGVGQHPHRGFETVTIVYDGEVAHRDSTGQGGTIGPGDVQWMTAGGGILHEEFHSPAYTRTGGPFRMVQLWVNLPAKHKMTAPGYQSILAADIPSVELAAGAGTSAQLDLPEGHNAGLVVLSGRIRVNGEEQAVGEAQMALLGREGAGAAIESDGDAVILVLSGEPIDEPIAGYGPFVMNSDAEIRLAIEDFNAGRFGQMADA